MKAPKMMEESERLDQFLFFERCKFNRFPEVMVFWIIQTNAFNVDIQGPIDGQNNTNMFSRGTCRRVHRGVRLTVQRPEEDIFGSRRSGTPVCIPLGTQSKKSRSASCPPPSGNRRKSSSLIHPCAQIGRDLALVGHFPAIGKHARHTNKQAGLPRAKIALQTYK